MMWFNCGFIEANGIPGTFILRRDPVRRLLAPGRPHWRRDGTRSRRGSGVVLVQDTALGPYRPGIRRAKETNIPATAASAVHDLRRGVVLIGVVVTSCRPAWTGAEEAIAGSVVAVGVAGYGLLSLFAPRLLEPSLDCSSRDALIDAYRTRFFLRMAFAESAALVGFVGFFLAGQWWLYPFGALFAAVGFIRLAPTRGNVARDQESLNLAGCGLDLVNVLTTRDD
ncbi:MAG: hypothetical protein U5K30_02395 [Acidimicrobiales bacterium]|nr:hypothetical protein [Acidimicrobiales bacterium]